MRPWRGAIVRVSAAAAVAAAFLGVGARPAAAATTVTITAPAQDGAVITDTSTPTLAVQASSDGYVCEIDMKLAATGGQPPPPAPSTKIDLRNTPPRSTTFTWTPSIPANGPYKLDVTMLSGVCGVSEAPSSASRTFSMAVPPVAPAGVTATANPDRTVKVSWKQNGEPDLVGYSVFRVLKGKSCPAPAPADRIATTTPSALTFTDTFGSADPGGDYCYSVEATRKGATASATVDSAPSTAAVATVPAASSGTGTSGTGTGGSGGAGGDGAGTGGASAGGTTLGPAPDSNGTAAAPGSPAATSGGALDLGFSSLLQKAQRAAAGNKPAAPAAEPDGGFLPTLPFKKGANPSDGTVTVGDSSTSIGSEGDNSDRVRLAGAIAAGLLALVVVGHLLLLRREVNRVAALEPMEPSTGAAGSSG